MYDIDVYTSKSLSNSDVHVRRVAYSLQA